MAGCRGRWRRRGFFRRNEKDFDDACHEDDAKDYREEQAQWRLGGSEEGRL